MTETQRAALRLAEELTASEYKTLWYAAVADIETLQQRVEKDEALLRQALSALEYASDLTKVADLQGCTCPICTNITAIKERLK